MAIKISRVAGKYLGSVSPPHGGGISWSTREPLAARDLIHELRRRGGHQTDIADAFYEGDDAWVLRLEGEEKP